MTTEFKTSFARDLRSLAGKNLRRRLQEIIDLVEKAAGPEDIPNLKKLRGTTDLYRIRMGEYRVGIIIQGGRVTFVRCLHRREIYRYFS